MNLKQIDELLNKPPEEIFGENPKKELDRLKKLCHPDRHLNDEILANKLFKKLQNIFEELNKPTPTVKSTKGEYKLTRPVDGDISTVYTSGFFKVKISKGNTLNEFLKREEKFLSSLKPENSQLEYSLPKIIDSFDVIQKGPKLRANVFDCAPYRMMLSNKEVFLNRPQTSITKLKEMCSIDERDFAWIFRRTMSTLSFLHYNGIVHGAVTPDHILVDTENLNNHGAGLIGFGQSVNIGERVKIVSNKYKDIYPPEILNKQPVTPEADVWMLCKTYQIVCKNISKPLDKFLNTVYNGARPNINELYSDFDFWINRNWGKEFRKLPIKKEK